jgi:hypothetical protein
VASVVLAVVIVIVVLPLARNRDTSNLGDDTFEVGRTRRIAAEIADRGPILYADPVGGNRPIWVQHVGPTEDTGWIVVAARDPDTGCEVDWDYDAETFIDCDGTDHGSAGEGLFAYPVDVEDGIVSADLNFASRPAEDDGTAG